MTIGAVSAGFALLIPLLFILNFNIKGNRILPVYNKTRFAVTNFIFLKYLYIGVTFQKK